MSVSTWPDVDPSFSITFHTAASCSKDTVCPVSSSERIYGCYQCLLQVESLPIYSYWSVQSTFSVCFGIMSSGAANLTCPNSIAAVSFIDAFGICLIIKWKQQYHFGSVVFVIPFTDRHFYEQMCLFSVF